MIKVPTITQLKQLISHIQGIVFPDYYPAVEAPHSLNLPDEFWSQIPEITRLLQTDVDAVLHNDPAVSDRGEVILSYPLPFAMVHYRAAHVLYRLGVPRIPRMLTELAHSRTGIDIHPAAQIGDHFCIDHLRLSAHMSFCIRELRLVPRTSNMTKKVDPKTCRVTRFSKTM